MRELPDLGRVGVRRKRRHWLRTTVIAVLLLVATLTLLTLSFSPDTAVSAPPSSVEVDSARRVYGRVRVAQMQTGPHRIDATWAELSAVAELGGRALGMDRMTFVRDGNRGLLSASVPLPLGLWSNVRARLQPDTRNNLRISGRIGRLPIPAFLVHAFIGVSRQVLVMRGVEFPPLGQIISRFDVSDKGLGAMVDMPRKSRFLSAMSSLRSGSIEPDRVESRYCQLVKQQNEVPNSDFAVHVSRAFSAGDGSVADNRAAFVALAMLTTGSDVGSLPAGPRAIFKRCGRLGTDLQLLGRVDLVKHWAMSAALTSVFGSQASISVGTWKEVSDSGPGGSGFSLVDLSADRSGAFIADHGARPEQAAPVRNWLSGVSQADLLPISALALAEGMTEAEFNSRYTSTDSSEFESTVQHIDDTLAVSSHF